MNGLQAALSNPASGRQVLFSGPPKTFHDARVPAISRHIPEPDMKPHDSSGPTRPQAHELPVPVGDRLGDWVGWWLKGRCGCSSKDIPSAC